MVDLKKQFNVFLKHLQKYTFHTVPLCFLILNLMFLSLISLCGEIFIPLDQYHLSAIMLENRFDFFFEASIAIIGVIITVMSIMIAITSSYYKIEIIELFIRDRINIFFITFSTSVFIFAYMIRLINSFGANLLFSTLFYLSLLLIISVFYIFYTFYILSSQRQTFFINQIFSQLLKAFEKIPKIKSPLDTRLLKDDIFSYLSQLLDLIDCNNDKSNQLIVHKVKNCFIQYRITIQNNKVIPSWYENSDYHDDMLNSFHYRGNAELFMEDYIQNEMINKVGHFIDNKDDTLLIHVVKFFSGLSVYELNKDLNFSEEMLKKLIKLLSVYYEKNECWKIDIIIDGLEYGIFKMLNHKLYHDKYIKNLIKELQLTSILFFQKKMPVIIDHTAMLTAKVIIYLDKIDNNDLANELLVILLNIDRPLIGNFSLERIDLSEQKGRAVRLIQIGVALYYLYKLEYSKMSRTDKNMTQALIRIIYNDMSNEPIERIQLVRNELESNLESFICNILRIEKIATDILEKYYHCMVQYFELFELSYQNTEQIKFKKQLETVVNNNINYHKPLGVVLIENEFIEKDDILKALSLQSGDQEVYLKDIFYPEKINKVLDKKLGQILMEQNLISKDILEEALSIQQQENKKISEKIVNMLSS